jgi:hypothetical protein
MNIIPLIIQLVALACLFFASFNLFGGPPSRPVWGWFGMFLWLLSLMVSAINLHATYGAGR